MQQTEQPTMTAAEPQSEASLQRACCDTLAIAPLATSDRRGARRAKPPVRVLHVINGEHYAGAERVQDLLAGRLPEFGFEVGFACLKASRFPLLRQSQDASLYDVSMRTWFDLSAAARIVRIIRREGYEIVHTHTPRAAMIGRLAAAWTGVPFVHHVHSPASRDSTRRWGNWLNGCIERLSLGRASRLITVSASLARHLKHRGFGETRVSVVPNGVPLMAPVPQRPLPQQPWTLGTAALFRPRKGIEVLLDALATLRRQSLPVRLRAVGPFESRPYEVELKAHAARRGLDDVVRWRGFARDVGAELGGMDLFVLPSLFGEGLPMAVLEAMAAGVPVVATRVEGVQELIRDGVDGVLARPGDPEDLARAIAQVVSGELDWSELRRSALRRQAEMFSDRSMAEGVAAAYRLVLEAGQAAPAAEAGALGRRRNP
jgi:glycosyltransferase involved in cell wall biosynthesis